MSDNIKVVVKVRPLIRRELEDKLLLQWRVNDNALIQLDQNGKDWGPVFTFDKVYKEETKTSDVYNDIAKPIVEAATAGFNGTIFAYGQTSSGKTYTMTGTEESPGIIPLAVLNLFDIIKNVPDRDFLVRVSYVEIYNESLIDLLNIEKRIKIHDTFGQGVKVDATEEVATSPDEVLEVMRKGKANRQTGATNMNDESSRSHSIFQITIESRDHIEGEEEGGTVNVSQLNLVDLAGSERAGQTGATGLRFKEGTHINKSLSVLALVIKQLSEDPNKHANYRDSKLTRLLQNSLGGNAKTSIICAVTPAALEETISTLQFANRAKSIKNTPAVNAVATNATMIQNLTKQLSALKTQLETKRSVEQDNFKLQKQIGSLQRLILNGFGQRSGTDALGGARRKIQNPRRVTISTLHPIQEDPVPTVPRFCTPSLKYNPISLNTLAEFGPIESTSNLSSVAEEPRLITPPPNLRKVTISDEIIEIDSDDDTSGNLQICSPYHGCFESSKTPPCVLRKNAKKAEKNLKDIMELTEREKLYSPDVVELMNKLEHKVLTITKLEETVNELNDLSKEKDGEIEKLKNKISQTDKEIQDIVSVKTKLETECKTYSTKLTDWEVSFETLQKKAKRREDELLSLLKEHEPKKKHEKIGKMSSKAIGNDLLHFMDMSKDISLVNSDNENSINIEETPLQPVPRTNNDFETKLGFKDQTILQLEANLHAQNLKIDSIEIINKNYQEMITDFRDKISFIENENVLLKLTIDNLNRTIENQQSITEVTKGDIECYNDIVKELNVKLSNKIDKFKDENDIKSMMLNEEGFIANSENMKNIIQVFRTALDLRNDEINNLKSSLDKSGNSQDFKVLEEELENKKKEISLLVKELESLKKDQIAEFDNFILTKNTLLSVEQQLKTQLSELQKLKDNEREAHLLKITELTRCNEDLTSDLMKNQQDQESLQSKLDNLSQELITLKKDIRTKDNIIAKLRNEENSLQEKVTKVTLQLQNIIIVLSGKIFEVPQMLDNLVSAFTTLTDNLTSLETICKETVKEKNALSVIVENYQKTFINIKSQIDGLDNAIDILCTSNKCLENEVLKNLDFDYNDSNINVQKDSPEHIELKMRNLAAKINTTLEYFNNSLYNKEMDLNNKQLESDSKLRSQTANYLERIEEMSNSQKLQITNILQKTASVATKFDIDSSIIQSDPDNTAYEQIISILDNIVDHVFLTKSEQLTQQENIQEVLSDAKNEINKLTKENSKLLQDILNLENSNKDLSIQIKTIQNDSKILTQNLTESNTILNEMRRDLVSKSNEIEIMGNKAKEWKNKFRESEVLTKEHIEMLEIENTDLKTRFLELTVPCEQSDSVSINPTSARTLISRQIINSPPRLVTICCNRIMECIQLHEIDNLESSSNTSTDLKYICQCTEQTEELNLLKRENDYLKTRIKQLEMTNDCLVKEQKETQNEVRLLVESTQDLQKRIVNHRTNLSTLSATTYAENKSLASRIKFLQHHHSRFHNVCQKDIPALKNQLHDLMLLLKTENIHKQNDSFKRYSLPNALDVTPLHSKFKNESILDGDLLMLDTNVTLTTCDNTLVGHDQTCLDVTRVCAYNEVACQTSLNEITHCDLLHSQMETQPYDCIKCLDTLKSLKEENNKLRHLVDEFYQNKNSKIQKNMTDKTTTPIKILNETDNLINRNDRIGLNCNCGTEDNVKVIVEMHKKEINIMSKTINELKSQKQDIEQKYHDLTLEVPTTELLVKKFNILEKDYCTKQNKITEISHTLITKQEEIVHLQEENDILSNQLMENISELDDLKKEHDSLKVVNLKLKENYLLLGEKLEDLKHKSEKENTCTDCKLKNDIIITLENKLSTDIKLDRSYSDSDSSSRCNKICSLQNELHAGKEDCIKLKEEVTTIKNQLDRSNLTISMDVDDDNMENCHRYSYDFENINSQGIKCDESNIAESQLISDKENCLSYYAEITGANIKGLGCETKLIDVMKMLYDFIEIKHANEVENLVNKVKDLEESKISLQSTLDDVNTDNLRIKKDLDEKNAYFQTMANVMSHIKNNIAILRDAVYVSDIIIDFKDNFLKVIDKEFGFNSTVIFEIAIQQLHHNHTAELESLRNDNTQLEDDLQDVVKKHHTITENFTTLTSQFIEKENEYKLLQRQKEQLHAINETVTLDIVKMEETLRQQIINGLQELVEKNIINEAIDFSLTTNKLIESLFKLTLKHTNYIEVLQNDKNNITAEVDELKKLLDIKVAELCTMTENLTELREKYSNFQLDLLKKEKELKANISQLENLNIINLKKVEENDSNKKIVHKLTEDINELKTSLSNKDILINTLQVELDTCKVNEEKNSQFLKTVVESQKEIEALKCMNAIIVKERENYSSELEKARTVIKQNKIDLDKLTKDINVLKESIIENSTTTDNLKRDFENLTQTKDTLTAVNKQLEQKLQERCQNCSRLEVNVKTYEKTAEIQNKIITRLQKQKEEDDKLSCEKDLKLEELNQKCKHLEAECEKILNDLKSSKDDIDRLRNSKTLLESKITTLEEEIQNSKRRTSIEATSETSRQRRRSMYDSKRTFAEDEEQEELKSHPTTEDVFMDVDGDSSNRSTPVFMHRGRDSLLSKHDQSDREEENSRSGSVQASRRRRQSAHDLHRSVRLSPTARAENSRETSRNNSMDSEVTQLRKQLNAVQKEFEELKEKYREVDEECEICAQYLHERDEQCAQLKKEKQELQNTIAELKEKLKNISPYNSNASKPSVAHASVNTDEDWANLHSVVVDRMSYDAEVEKSKKLLKTIEELRFNKQALKVTMSKMQKALDKHSIKDKELQEALASLARCERELAELRQRCAELGDECERSGRRARELDDRCRRLQDAKAALEAKLLECGEAEGGAALRRRRQALHDRRRARADSSDDLTPCHVERDSPKGDHQTTELKRLQMTLEKVSQQKSDLEHQLSLAPQYVATGSAIVQNQQITDVIKENQKLKKINAKLVTMCKKRGKALADSNIENERPPDQFN